MCHLSPQGGILTLECTLCPSTFLIQVKLVSGQKCSRPDLFMYPSEMVILP